MKHITYKRIKHWFSKIFISNTGHKICNKNTVKPKGIIESNRIVVGYYYTILSLVADIQTENKDTLALNHIVSKQTQKIFKQNFTQELKNIHSFLQHVKHPLGQIINQVSVNFKSLKSYQVSSQTTKNQTRILQEEQQNIHVYMEIEKHSNK